MKELKSNELREIEGGIGFWGGLAVAGCLAVGAYEGYMTTYRSFYDD
jgi:lactobin A/cerein 7B family class IIb bacteriocin